MFAESTISADAELIATLIRNDGTHRLLTTSDRRFTPEELRTKLILSRPNGVLRRIYRALRHSNVIPVAMGFAAFLTWLNTGDASQVGQALVTTVGINYLAADFLSSSSNHVANFNYHDSGTGSTAAAITDTTLTQAGPTTRATGTQSTPAAGQYRSTGTITYGSSLAISEWGLFSQAAQGGTLWDRRVLSVYNVSNTDAITFQYTVTFNAGGS